MKRILFIVSLLVVTVLSVQVSAQQTEPESALKRIELAKAQIKRNPSAAEEAFNDILKGKNKKNPDLLIAIGEAYLENNNTGIAATYLDRVMELNNKYAPAYLLAGDIALSKDNVGEACSKYEQAIYFDSTCKEAYMKYAHTYAGVNSALAIEMLQKLQVQDPSYLPAEKELANIYYSMGEYGKAKDAFERFFATGQPDMNDLTNYGMVLFLAKDYTRSLEIVGKGLVKDPGNHILKRLAMYNNYELKQNEAGLAAATRFFDNPNNPDYVYLDYLYYGRLLSAFKQADKAIVYYEKALKMDPEKVEIWKELSDTYEKLHNYDKAIEAYNSYLKGQEDPAETSDLFLLGRLYYYVGSAESDSLKNDPGKKKELLAHADSIFGIVAERVSDNYLGNFWRARTNSLLDPETTEGLAKPYYEAALAILESKPDVSKSLLIECDSYLGYYYFVKNDYPTSKTYWNKILTIDPGNETAKKALEGIK